MIGHTPALVVEHLGRTRYRDALEYQRGVMERRKAGLCADTLLLTEHEPVLTLGRRAIAGRHIRADAETLDRLGIEVIAVERGGDVTYHGPGQLVAYPILDLTGYGRDIRRHVRQLEECAIRLLARYSIIGERRAGTPGVWANDAKIASIGVFISRWVTMHGIAINIDPDLTHFDLIDPCGVIGMRMTSIAAETRCALSLDHAARAFESVFREEYLSPRPPPLAREGES